MPTSVKIDDELKKRIQRLADMRQRSAHWIMRQAILDYVEHEEKKERFKEEAAHAWTAYQETGRRLTGQETRDWLNTWGTEKETSIAGISSQKKAKSIETRRVDHRPPICTA